MKTETIIPLENVVTQNSATSKLKLELFNGGATAFQDGLPTSNSNREISSLEISPQTEIVDLGGIRARTDVESTMGPFKYTAEYKAEYPTEVVSGLGALYTDYNKAFKPLVEANREWDTDYQYCVGPDGNPINYFVQVDMMGLPAGFLRDIQGADPQTARRVLEGSIFEIENSLAMYGLLNTIFSEQGRASGFEVNFRSALDTLRRRFEKPIALLAVTEQKHQAMRESEFGKVEGETLTDEEVNRISGFDRLFGPEEFLEHIRRNGGTSDYLLYARTSDPVAKLKRPDLRIDNPLLANPEIRRIIKAHALTYNIDNPEWESDSPRRINDTKEYLPSMGLAFPATSETDVLDVNFAQYLGNGAKGDYTGQRIIAPELAAFLQARGIKGDEIDSGNVKLRAKPMKGTYGCYGHTAGTVHQNYFRKDVRKGIKDRGPYVIQPEIKPPYIVDAREGIEFTYIDRNFLSFVDGKPQFMGGFRSLMPTDTTEALMGRNHGSKDTVWAEIK